MVEWTCDYGDGRLHRNVTIGELEDGEAIRVTDYWGEPTITPKWREAMTDRLEMPGDGIWPTRSASDSMSRPGGQHLRLTQSRQSTPRFRCVLGQEQIPRGSEVPAVQYAGVFGLEPFMAHKPGPFSDSRATAPCMPCAALDIDAWLAGSVENEQRGRLHTTSVNMQPRSD